MCEDSGGDTDTDGSGGPDGASESVYEAIFRGMDDAVFLVNVEQADSGHRFVFRRGNASYREQTGVTEDGLRGRTPQEALGDERGTAVAANCRRCVEREETVEYEQTLDRDRDLGPGLDLSGGVSHWETRLTPITEDGQVTRIVGVGRDITEQNEQEQRLQRTARRFETVLETMSAAVFLKDTDGRYLLMNQACRELFGLGDRDIVGLTDGELFSSAVAERAQSDDRRVIENAETIELEETVPTAAGNTVRLTRKSPVYDGDGEVTALCGVSTDITGQKQQERSLQRLKERFELAVEGADLGVWDWDMTTDEVEFNEQWVRMLGHSPDEIAPRFEEWEQRVHPDDRDRIDGALDGHIAGETELYEVEHRMRTAAGDWKWVRAIGRVAERDGDDDPVRAVGIHLDIDEPKRYEQTLERQRDSLEVLNQVVRHDVRSALQRVLAYGELLQGDPGDSGEEYRRQVLEAGREAVDITETAGDVTEVLLRSEADRTSVDLRPVLAEQVEDVQAGHERAIVSVEGSLPDVEVLADDMVASVFRNLLNNAVVHNDKDTPEVTLTASATDGAVQVRVADNGPGIPDGRRDRVFEESERGLDSEGIGLGLYLVRTLVDRYGGAVRVTDNDPEGSVFVVELVRCG